MSTLRLVGQSHAALCTGSSATLLLGSQRTAAGTGRVPTSPPPEVGDYALVDQIARGGMSGVYVGQHRTTQDRVAIKVLAEPWLNHGNLVQRLLDECAMSHKVAHRGVLRIQSAGRTPEGFPYLVMELLDGESLACLLDRGPLAIGAVLAIGAQIADATAAIHDAGVVHCDLKPDNVMLLYQAGLAGWPAAKVIDFGVARPTGAVLDEVAGTPGYMAPEQWHGRAEPRTDVYALGCTLYELVTGGLPFEGGLATVREAHCDALPVPPSAKRDLPDELERMIMRMLAKDARMRPRMAEVARGLTDLARTRTRPTLSDAIAPTKITTASA